MKKIAVLGLGSWGFTLASHLASKEKYEISCWSTDPLLVKSLKRGEPHPKYPKTPIRLGMYFSSDLERVICDADMIVESVTSQGIRPVFENMRALGIPDCALVLTSKGIEQDTGKILPEVALEVLGEHFRPYLGVLSGPSFAQEVIRGLPTSVVAAAYHNETILSIIEIFTTPNFRVYPNQDILGVALGGSLKNIIAIACGISDGLELGSSSKAALITRGLHEIRKLAIVCGCRTETINGLACLGDLCLTCSSPLSRNFRFGMLLAAGLDTEAALKEIGMVVEGMYTCVSALQLAKLHNISLPIAEGVHQIIQGNITPTDAVRLLMQRSIKEEHL